MQHLQTTALGNLTQWPQFLSPHHPLPARGLSSAGESRKPQRWPKAGIHLKGRYKCPQVCRVLCNSPSHGLLPGREAGGESGVVGGPQPGEDGVTRERVRNRIPVPASDAQAPCACLPLRKLGLLRSSPNLFGKLERSCVCTMATP